jgi:hypothetical protein
MCPHIKSVSQWMPVLQKKFLALWYQISLGNWSTFEVMFDDRGEWRGRMLQFRVALGLGWKTSKILIYICLIPNLNSQSSINGLLVVQDFCFWAVWAAGPVLKKKIGPIMSNFWGRFFHGAKKKLNFLKTLKSCIISLLWVYFFNYDLSQNRLVHT